MTFAQFYASVIEANCSHQSRKTLTHPQNFHDEGLGCLWCMSHKASLCGIGTPYQRRPAHRMIPLPSNTLRGHWTAIRPPTVQAIAPATNALGACSA